MALEVVRLLALKGALTIEVRTGMHHSAGKAFIANQVRQVMGVTTKSKVRLLKEYVEWLHERGYLFAKEDRK